MTSLADNKANSADAKNRGAEAVVMWTFDNCYLSQLLTPSKMM